MGIMQKSKAEIRSLWNSKDSCTADIDTEETIGEGVVVGAIASKALIKDGFQLGVILVVCEELSVETWIKIDSQGLE